jgi:hypothetical protein
VITLITGDIPWNGNRVIVDAPDLANCFNLTLQGAGCMIILVKSSCHLPWTQPFWKTLDKQFKYFLAFLRAFDLLDADTPRRSWPRCVVQKQVIFMACLFRVAASTR